MAEHTPNGNAISRLGSRIRGISIIFELPSALRSNEKQQLETGLNNRIDASVSVEEGISLDRGGSTDIRIDISGSTVEDEEFNHYRDALRAEGVEISGWRIGQV